MADKRKKLYATYYNMKTRCNNPNNNRYHRYKSIAIEWLTFEDFYMDMSETYMPGYSIERIDNNGNYSKTNCRWATAKEQANNRNTSRFITYAGKTLTIAQWSDVLGVKYSTFKQRFYVYKWPLERLIGGSLG